MHKSGNDITVSINNSIATLQAVLKRSIELGKGKNIYIYIHIKRAKISTQGSHSYSLCSISENKLLLLKIYISF